MCSCKSCVAPFRNRAVHEVCVCVRCEWVEESEGACIHVDSEWMGEEGEGKGVAVIARALKCTVQAAVWL